MLEYRNTKFIYHEWKAYNGDCPNQQATGELGRVNKRK